MIKNLYIYVLNEDGKFTKRIWEDIKVTRSEGNIVTKKESKWKLENGRYRNKSNIDKIRTIEIGHKEVCYSVEYISFNEDIPEEKLEEMKLLIHEVLRARKQLLQAQVELIEKKETIINNLTP